MLAGLDNKGEGAGAIDEADGWQSGTRGPDNRRKCFPQLQRLPAPKSQWDWGQESLTSGIAKGEGSGGRETSEKGRIQAQRAGFDEQKWDFPRLYPPPEWRQRCAHNSELP